MIKLKKLQYRSLWYKKLYYYMQAGQSLPEAVKVSGTDVEMQLLHKELETGKRLSEILHDDFRDVFSFLEMSLVGVAEKTGKIKEIFLSLSTLLKAQYTQRQKVIAAAIYPIIVLCLAIGLLIMILTVIVPKIGPLFSDIKDLPISTELLLSASKHIRTMWWLDCLILIVFVISHFGLKKYSFYKKFLKKISNLFFFHMFYIKDLYMLWYTEKWMQVTCVGLSSHISLHQSLNLASSALENVFMQQEFRKVELAVEEGNTCADSLKLLDKRLYNRLNSWESVIRSGEHTGALLEVFVVCHEHIQTELNDAFDKAQKMIEPALIIGVGVMVLGICLSIILPMYQLTQSLNQ